MSLFIRTIAKPFANQMAHVSSSKTIGLGLRAAGMPAPSPMQNSISKTIVQTSLEALKNVQVKSATPAQISNKSTSSFPFLTVSSSFAKSVVKSILPKNSPSPHPFPIIKEIFNGEERLFNLFGKEVTEESAREIFEEIKQQVIREPRTPIVIAANHKSQQIITAFAKKEGFPLNSYLIYGYMGGVNLQLLKEELPQENTPIRNLPEIEPQDLQREEVIEEEELLLRSLFEEGEEENFSVESSEDSEILAEEEYTISDLSFDLLFEQVAAKESKEMKIGNATLSIGQLKEAIEKQTYANAVQKFSFHTSGSQKEIRLEMIKGYHIEPEELLEDLSGSLEELNEKYREHQNALRRRKLEEMQAFIKKEAPPQDSLFDRFCSLFSEAERDSTRAEQISIQPETLAIRVFEKGSSEPAAYYCKLGLLSE